MSYTYKYARPAVTVDAVIFGFDWAADMLGVLMIRRGKPPFEGHRALPGGFLEIDEPSEVAARRELREETGWVVPAGVPFEPLGFYDEPGRDPRGRTISLVYATVAPPPLPEPAGDDDAADAAWVRVADLASEPLAFDHNRILEDGLDWLKAAVEAGPAGLALLPESFDRTEARRLFAAIGLSTRRVGGWLNRQLQTERLKPLIETPGVERFRRRDAGPNRPSA